MTDNPTKSPRCDNAQSRLRARVFLARYAHLSLSETEGMTDDDLQTACENIAGFLQAELRRQDPKAPTLLRIQPPVIRRADPEGLLEALSQPIGEPDAEIAMLRGKADAADALLAALGTEETEVALQRLDTLRTAAATLKALDGILEAFDEPEKCDSTEPKIVRRARGAVEMLGLPMALLRQQAAAVAKPTLDAVEAERVRAVQRIRELEAERDAFLAVLRCVGESLCVDLDGCSVGESEAKLCNAVARMRGKAAQLDKLIAVAREHGLALDPRDAGDCLGPWIAEQREQLNLERMAVARFHGAAEKDRAEREEQARELAWFRDLWGRIVGERPVVGAAGPLGSRYRLVEPHKLKAAAEVRDLPVAAIARARAVTEPGFWTDWLDELSREFRRLDGLRQGAEDAYSKVSRVIDTLTAILKGENPPVVGNETALELVARGLVADREAHRAAERVLIEAAVPAVTSDEPYIVRLARGAVQALKGATRPAQQTTRRFLGWERVSLKITSVDREGLRASGVVERFGTRVHGGPEPLRQHLEQPVPFEVDASTTPPTCTTGPAVHFGWEEWVAEIVAAHLRSGAVEAGLSVAELAQERERWTGDGSRAELDLSRLRTALAEIPTLTPQQVVDAAAATIVELRGKLQEKFGEVRRALCSVIVTMGDGIGDQDTPDKLADKAIKMWRKLQDRQAKAARERDDLAVKLEGAEAAATEARHYVTRIREALDLPAGADVFDCVRKAGNIRKRRELKAELDAVRVQLDTCARAADVPWHELAGWIVTAKAQAAMLPKLEAEIDKLADLYGVTLDELTGRAPLPPPERKDT